MTFPAVRAALLSYGDVFTETPLESPIGSLYRLYIGIADGMSVARLWARRYSKCRQHHRGGGLEDHCRRLVSISALYWIHRGYVRCAGALRGVPARPYPPDGHAVGNADRKASFSAAWSALLGNGDDFTETAASKILGVGWCFFVLVVTATYSTLACRNRCSRGTGWRHAMAVAEALQ